MEDLNNKKKSTTNKHSQVHYYLTENFGLFLGVSAMFVHCVISVCGDDIIYELLCRHCAHYITPHCLRHCASFRFTVTFTRVLCLFQCFFGHKLRYSSAPTAVSLRCVDLTAGDVAESDTIFLVQSFSDVTSLLAVLARLRTVRDLHQPPLPVTGSSSQ